jgi:tRNA-uridine 2-sulfurtransferase
LGSRCTCGTTRTTAASRAAAARPKTFTTRAGSPTRWAFPHYAFDRRELFQREVVAPFVDSYLDGETPSPCVRCNRGVKIKELLALADKLDASRVATGHCARLVERDGRTELHRGRDAGKDQSYFLHMLGEASLSRLCFPLGDADKAEVATPFRGGSLGLGRGRSGDCHLAPPPLELPTRAAPPWTI